MFISRNIYILAGLLLGLTYTTWIIHRTLSSTLPLEQEEIPLQVAGDIVSLPVYLHGQATFNFHITKPNYLVKLAWPKPPTNLRVGDHWQLLVKLRRIHGLHNPGGFNYESWAMQHGLTATGRVIAANNVKMNHSWLVHPIDQIRQDIFIKLQQHMPPSNTAHWLTALALGERQAIPQEQWQVLRSTGTNHLMAIGGLHIGMVAGFFHLIVTWCWRRLPRLMLRLPAQEAGACGALIAGLLYGALSGFAIPAQRACLMLAVYALAILSRRKMSAWYVWIMALLVVLIINPLSFLSESFWLSFGTIALIIFGMNGRLLPQGLWWKWGRVQWVIGLGLLPLSLLFFQEVSLASVIANSVAIPWLGCLILPFCLLGMLFIFIIPPVGDLLLYLADKSLSLLWELLSFISQWHLATWSQAMPNYFILILSTCGILIFITSMKFPARWFGIIWLLPLIMYQPTLLPIGQAEVALLDVGQGLSVVVQTRQHVLIFDTGPSHANVVVPYLRTQFIKNIDTLVISHGDEDHIGGTSEILKNIPTHQIFTSVPEKFSANLAQLCLAGQQWQWDGVKFAFLYPFNDTLHLGNDSSCVLRIDAGKDSVLIPGDIEKFAEEKLLERATDKLNVTTLIAPHHGSSTSGLPEFITAVYPRYVMYAVGYRNRYHFPHSTVVSSYRAIHTESFDSVDHGAIEWIMGGSKTLIDVFRPKNT